MLRPTKGNFVSFQTQLDLQFSDGSLLPQGDPVFLPMGGVTWFYDLLGGLRNAIWTAGAGSASGTARNWSKVFPIRRPKRAHGTAEKLPPASGKRCVANPFDRPM